MTFSARQAEVMNVEKCEKRLGEIKFMLFLPEAIVPCPRVNLMACTSVSNSPSSFVRPCDCVLILGREGTGPMLSTRSGGTLTTSIFAITLP